MSQLLSRIETRLQASSDPTEIAELQVRKSCYLSRTGYFQESRALIKEARIKFGSGENARISAWIMLAEGIAEFFQNCSPAAKDRIARAQLISLAIRDKQLGAISSAWKAHLDFEASDFESMARSLITAIEMSDDSNHEANSRVAMILSHCMYLYGDRTAAQRWFMVGRDHALADGDQATIDALLHNRAAFGTACLRAERCLGSLDKEILHLVSLEVSSAENFQSLAKIISLNHLIHLCKARILMLGEQFEQALETFSSVRTARPFANNNFSEGIIDLEMAFCLQKLGREEQALTRFRCIENDDWSAFDIDDRLVIAWTRLELAKENRHFGDVAALESDLAELKVGYLDQNSRLRSIISSVVEERRDWS